MLCKLKNKFIVVLLCLCVVLGLSACGNAAETSEEKGAVSFVDDDGVEINLDRPAEKIISMYSAHTENLYYIGAGDKLIGGYKTCVYPPEAAFLDMYDYKGDPEEIIAAQPDVLLIRPFIREKAPDYVKAVENAGITVVSLYPSSFDEFDGYINKLAVLTGTEENAKARLEEFHSEINRIKEITSKQENKNTIFFESTDVEIRTVTPDSMAGLAIEFAGGINLAKDAAPIEEGSTIAPFGVEKVLENADNIDVYVSQRGSMNSGGNLISIGERPGYETIKAVKEGRVFLINEKLVSSPSFRYVKGVKELARFLYPDVMDNYDEYKNDEKATRRAFADMIVKAKHLPIYLPTSSSYYTTEQKGHTFGLFRDISWQDKDFDYIETAVEYGYALWDRVDDEQYYYPDKEITRDELAQCIFVMGDFKSKDASIEIKDLEKSKNRRLVQILVDNNVFELNDGNFEPDRTVTDNEVIKALEFVK